MSRRRFSKTRQEMRRIAVDQASESMADVIDVIRRVDRDLMRRPSGCAGIFAVAHAAYEKALATIEIECEIHEGIAYGPGPTFHKTIPNDCAVPSPLTTEPDPPGGEIARLTPRHAFVPAPGNTGSTMRCAVCGFAEGNLAHRTRSR